MTWLHDNFDDAIFSDETTVQLDTHHRRCYRKEGEKPRLKLRPKRPTKVHVWGGISKKVQHQYVFLKEPWMQHCFVKYSEGHYCLFLLQNIHPLVHTASSKIMIRSTCLVWRRNFRSSRKCNRLLKYFYLLLLV